MQRRPLDVAIGALAIGPALAVALLVLSTWARRFGYPFDLEWMESGMLAHVWRVDHGLPIYVRPNVDFMPFVYPPGYSWVVAGLSQVAGLSLQAGRAVSIASTIAAAAALMFGFRRAGASWALCLGAAAVMLGTYPQSGAFYDIVRPDALSLALFAWAIVLGLEEDRRAPVAAGLLLAGAFLVKQNAAIAGLPMLIGLAMRGWRPAVAFAAASIGPALGAVALLQWRSGGAFLVWLVEVPRSQNLVWTRAWLDTPREWGTALPVALAAMGLWACWEGAARQRAIPAAVAAIAPVWFGALGAWWFTYEPPPDGAPVYNSPASLAYWAIGAIPAALALRVAGGLARRELPPWRGVYLAGVLLTVGAMSLAMRVHDGGYINVHMPVFWCIAGAFGAVLLGVERAGAGRPAIRATVSGALAVQLAWSLALLHPGRLVPTPADVAAGWRIVDRIRGIDGPILSPFSAWIPVYAGQAPSLHAQGVWDVNYAGGPYRDDLVVIERALRDHHWSLIIGGQATFLGDLTKHYEVADELIPIGDPRLTPKTGVDVRPWRVLVPRP
jgi:hypothetical protein